MYFLVLLFLLCVKAFRYTGISFPKPVLQTRSVFSRGLAKNKSINPEMKETISKDKALHLLDCLTSPRDPSDPQYDIDKDTTRANLLQNHDYSQLKVELYRRELDLSGDKMEMLTRFLLHIIDPSIKFNDM